MKLFGSSGIRGVAYQDITSELCRAIGQAVGTMLPPQSRVCIATDTRSTREMLKSAVLSGLLATGIDATDFGIVPTPVLALLTRELGFDTGFMITASHNPPEFNGMKLFNSDSLGYSKAQEAEIEKICRAKKFRSGCLGTLTPPRGVNGWYFEFIHDRFSENSFNHGLRIVVDPGNGAAAGFASALFSSMGFEVIPVNDERNGLFPGRNPEPREDTLQGTVEFLRKHGADLAICFDGDADRVVFCDKDGFLGFNEMIAFVSRIIVMETGKKKIATTVETGKLLDLVVKDLGVQVVRGEVGDVNAAHLALELDAALGVEEVGVYIIPEAGYYPDSFVAALKLLSYLRDTREIREFFNGMPKLCFEKGKIDCPNELKEEVIAKVKKKAHLFGASDMNVLDGVRLEFDGSWMLVRASGTEPAIRIIAESPSKSRTKRLLAEGTEAVRSCLGSIAQ
jgi:phosphoglucosamine mutase